MIDSIFNEFCEVEGVAEDGGSTTSKYTEDVTNPTEIILVAKGKQLDEVGGIIAQLTPIRHQMHSLVKAYSSQLDTEKGLTLREMIIRKYEQGDTVKEFHKDNHSLAVLRYFGKFRGGDLGYHDKSGKVHSVPVSDGDIVVMCGSRIKHGCRDIKSGVRYVLIEFYDLDTSVPFKKRRVK